VAAQAIGEAAVIGVGGYEWGDARNGGLAGGVARFALQHGAFSVGPELLVANGRALRVRALSGVARLRQGRGWARPYLLVGLGAYAWQDRVELEPPVLALSGGPAEAIATTDYWRETRYFSGSLGGGVAIGSPGGRPEVVLEARWHRNLSQRDEAGARSFLTVGVGLQFAW
jgi:hypothetical protein